MGKSVFSHGITVLKTSFVESLSRELFSLTQQTPTPLYSCLIEIEKYMVGLDTLICQFISA